MTYPIPIEHIKSLWIERINKTFEEQMLLVLGGSTQMERDTWALQLAAAQARLAGTSTTEQNALLSAICAGGETADTLAIGHHRQSPRGRDTSSGWPSASSGVQKRLLRPRLRTMRLTQPSRRQPTNPRRLLQPLWVIKSSCCYLRKPVKPCGTSSDFSSGAGESTHVSKAALVDVFAA